MAKWTDLLDLLHSGAAPHEIIEKLGVGLWRLRELLHGKRLQAWLAMENELAALSVERQRASQAVHMVNRLRELADGEKEETARKACENLLAEPVANGSVSRRSATSRRAGAQLGQSQPTAVSSDERIRKLISQGRLPAQAEAMLSWKDEAFKRQLIRLAKNAQKGEITVSEVLNLCKGNELRPKPSRGNVGDSGECPKTHPLPTGKSGNHGESGKNGAEYGLQATDHRLQG